MVRPPGPWPLPRNVSTYCSDPPAPADLAPAWFCTCGRASRISGNWRYIWRLMLSIWLELRAILIALLVITQAAAAAQEGRHINTGLGRGGRCDAGAALRRGRIGHHKRVVHTAG